MRTNNYCRSNGMSICTAGERYGSQIRCYYSKRHSWADRCRFYRDDLNGGCDSTEAQKDRDDPSTNHILPSISVGMAPPPPVEIRRVSDAGYKINPDDIKRFLEITKEFGGSK